MAKTSSVERNNKRKKMNNKLSKKRDIIKSEIMNKKTSLEQRFELVTKLSKLPRNSATNRIRNRCSITGRPRGYFRKVGLSRIKLRDLAAFGMLPGVVKSSW